MQRRNGRLSASTGHRQRRRHLAKTDRFGFTLARGQRGGKATNKGIASSGGIHRLDLRGHQVLKALAVGKQRTLSAQGDDDLTGTRLDQRGRGDLGAVQ